MIFFVLVYEYFFIELQIGIVVVDLDWIFLFGVKCLIKEKWKIKLFKWLYLKSLGNILIYCWYM